MIRKMRYLGLETEDTTQLPGKKGRLGPFGELLL